MPLLSVNTISSPSFCAPDAISLSEFIWIRIGKFVKSSSTSVWSIVISFLYSQFISHHDAGAEEVVN